MRGTLYKFISDRSQRPMVFSEQEYKQYDEFLVSEVEAGLWHVQLNNPKTLNAFSEKTWRQYAEILTKLDQDSDVNVILISSTSQKAFTSGLNLKSALETFGDSAKLTDEERYKTLHQHIREFQYCITTPARIQTPTIGLFNGVSYGLALDMAACYTIRVAVENVKFSIREIKIGISADIGSLQRLPGLVNNKSALYQHALTGDIFGAQEALNLGFISKVVPTLEAGVEYIKELGLDIAGNQQWAIYGTKKHIQEITDGVPVEQGLKNIAHYNATHIDKRFVEAIMGVKL